MNKNKFTISYILIISLVSVVFLFSCSPPSPEIEIFNSNIDTFVIKENVVAAHRGAWKTLKYPENSISSLQHSIDLKCTYTEFDVRMTLDDSLVINHDNTFQEMFIERTLFSKLREKKLFNGEDLPTLREYLKAVDTTNSKVKFLLEIKPSEIGGRGNMIAEKVYETVQKLNLQNKLYYLSFDYQILKKIIELNPNNFAITLKSSLSLDTMKKDGIRGIDYDWPVLFSNPLLIAEAKEKGLLVGVWTVNKSKEMDFFLQNKVDFITTDEPELLFKRMNEN